MSRPYSDRMLRREGKTSWPDAAPQSRKTGTITRWNIERGFGFIRRDDGRPDLFVHINQVEDHVEDVAVGQRVKFMVGTNPQSSKYEALVMTKTK